MMYKKVRYACDYCTKRKRKCDRNLPCAFCVNRNVACHYSQQEDFEKHLQGVENRIKHMEETFLSPTNGLFQAREKLRPIVKEIVLSKELEWELFNNNHEHLLKLRFEKFPSIIFGIKEGFYRQSANQFWPLRFALYACGALFIRQEQLPKGISNRIELVNIFIQKAQSFNFCQRCDYLTVMTLEIIANVCYQINSTEEAIIYFKIALQHARICGLSSEEGISEITTFDYERENLRRLWWLLYRDFSYTSRVLGYDAVDNQENKVLLPSQNFYFESATSLDYYGVEIMSSKEWYIPTPPNLDMEGYHCILQAIQLNVEHLHELEMIEYSSDLLYSTGAINASLIDWNEQFSPKLHHSTLCIINRSTENQDQIWLTLYTALIYCSIRVTLVVPSLIRTVIHRKPVLKLLYFQEAIDAALTCTKISQLILEYNPSLQQFAIAALFALFPCGFILLCGRKLQMDQLDTPYKQLLDAIKQFNWAFQKMNQFHFILTLLEEKDLVDIVIYYGIFNSRQKRDLIERPATSPISIFSLNPNCK